MQLESKSIRLLATLIDNAWTVIDPAQFTELLYLRAQGYAEVFVKDGSIVAQRTDLGRAYSSTKQPRI